MAARNMLPLVPAAPALDRTVVFSNLAPDFNELVLHSLFGPLGMIHSEISQAPGGLLQARVIFQTPEQAQAALRYHAQPTVGQPMFTHVPQDAYMKGPQPFMQPGRLPLALNVDLNSNLGGRPRIAAGPALGGQRHRGMELEPTHRNLYVLNLPLDATTDQLAALFSNYGPVVHCVILAMLDAQARRRGFIDMAGPHQAKEAIEALNGFVWHGYPIEVSYAIVQRSGGPFEQSNGRHVIKRNVPRNRFNTGPRRVPSEAGVSPILSTRQALLGNAGAVSASANGIVGFDLAGSSVYEPSLAGGYGDLQGSAQSYFTSATMSGASNAGSISADPCTLFISGLDPVAILDEEDLRRRLEMYGPVQAVSLSRDAAGTSRGYGVVTFVHDASARKAKAALDGKIVDGRKVSAHHLPFSRAGFDLGAQSVNTSSTSSPMTGFSSTLSGFDSGSITSSPEYRRTTSGYSLSGTPASIAPSLPGSTTAGSGGSYGSTTFSTPQPMSTSGSSSDFPNYSLPVAPATEGPAPFHGANGRQANIALRLGFTGEQWNSAASGKPFRFDSRATGQSPGANGRVTEMSNGLAEPFVPRSDISGAVGSDLSQGTEPARSQGDDRKGFSLGSAFESPSVHSTSPSTLKSGSAAFSSGVFGSSNGGRGPLDSTSLDRRSADVADGDQTATGAASFGSRPRSRASGSLGITLGADVAASIAAAAVAPPASLSRKAVLGRPADASDNGPSDVSRSGSAVTDSTPKLDGQPFPGSTHSTPLNRRGHGYGHAHMYNHLTRSAGPSGSIGSIGSISHTGSTSAMSAASWARTPQSSLSSLEQISPASGTSALGFGTPVGAGLKSMDGGDELSHGFGYVSGDQTLKGNGTLHSTAPSISSSSSSSHIWSGAGDGTPWLSPQAVASSFAKDSPQFERRNDASFRDSSTQGPSSDTSTATEKPGHASLRSLHQGSPPYSAAQDAVFRKVPLAPVGHEKSASIISPHTRVTSGSIGGGHASSFTSTAVSKSSHSQSVAAHASSSDKNGAIDLSSALGGLNIST